MVGPVATALSKEGIKMAKLSNTTTALSPSDKKKKGGKSPIKAKKKETVNHSGGDATRLKTKSELFLAAISTFAGEDTYYEKGQDRIDRIVNLTHKVTEKDPEWMQRFIPWLRGPEVNIRTISLIIAAEYVAAGGPNGRQVINSVCQRADEPAEILAYWMQRYYGWDTVSFPLPSPKLPQPLRKGLADAAIRLYNEYSLLKYDGNSRGVGMADVLNLVHPARKQYPADWTESRKNIQQAIFQYIIDSYYGREPNTELLPMVDANLQLRKKSGEEIREHFLATDILRAAGVTWEQLGPMLQGPWDAKAWEAIIPTMGYMAILRNLRNFEGAGISKTYQRLVIEKLTDPEEVEKSRQLPFRFLSAFKSVNSSTYLPALEEALNLSCKNIPTFEGRTLILVDKSGSMSHPLSSNSSMQRWEVGALFGMALHIAQGNDSDIAIFGDYSKKIRIPKGTSVLQGIKKLAPNNGVGHGTQIWSSAANEWDGHDRIVIFTDMQSNYFDPWSYGETIRPEDVLKKVDFMHYFNLGGYGHSAPLELVGANRYDYGGFSDATFKLMALLETQTVGWPF